MVRRPRRSTLSPEAPLSRAVNVTFTPATGLLPASRTVTASALAHAVPTEADCRVAPPVAVIGLPVPGRVGCDGAAPTAIDTLSRGAALPSCERHVHAGYRIAARVPHRHRQRISK